MSNVDRPIDLDSTSPMQQRAARDSRQVIRKLAELRAERGFTQAYVAEKMGTTQPYVARLEAAGSDPRFSTLLRYALIVAGAALVAAILSEIEGQGRS